MKTDSLFYRLFQQLPTLAFELIGLDVPNAEGYRFGSEEVKQTTFRLDGILFPPSENPAQPILFIEAQFQPDAGFYSRFFSEIFLFLRHYEANNPWQSVVIYPNRQTEQNPVGHYDVLLESNRVHRIFLEDIAEQRTEEIGINLLQLIALEEKKAARQAFALVERIREKPADVQWTQRMLDLIETIMAYKLPRLDREEIQKMLNINDVELKQTRFYQDVFAEGKLEGEARLIVRLLTRRFGPPEADAVERIRKLSIAELEALGDALLDFAGPDDLRRWLKMRAG